MTQSLTAVARTSVAVGETSSRLAKARAIAELLVGTPAIEVPLVVAWLSGDLPQRQIGVGWAALRSLPSPAETPTLGVAEVDATFTRIKAVAGSGSQVRRTQEVESLFARATDEEQRFLVRLLGGELRQGALAGVMTDAVARAAAVPLEAVRRAAMLAGDLPAVARVALADGVAGLDTVGLEVGRPVGPMLASTATSVADALERIGETAIFEAKLDGARIQVHRDGSDVRIFTRTLDDITNRLPEVVEVARSLRPQRFVLDGEAIGLQPDGRPVPFQQTASRFGRKVDLAAARAAQPLTPFFFDVLHLDGDDVLDLAAEQRFALLDSFVPVEHRVQRLATADADAGQAFLDATLAAGHEGLLAKSPTTAYEAGRRGAGWLKIKPVHTLDLVVLAVEWGSGRRTATLSNIHLGALDPTSGGFIMLGKTFKGMTDEMLAWQTARFTSLADGPTDGWVVPLRPEQVVEIAFDGVQRSSRYPGGVALRFARVLRYRSDKTVAEIDTIDTVRSYLK